MFPLSVKFACCLICLAASANVWAQSEAATDTGLTDTAMVQATTQRRHGLDPASQLIERIGATPEVVIQIFREAGLSPTAYALTAADLQKIAEAITILPPLHQEVLQQRLRSLSFVENMPNTALTSTVNPAEPCRLFDITIRAAILKQSASEWVAEKEGSCFDLSNSEVRIQADVGTITAIQYVLLHEATHVVDATKDITPSIRSGPEPGPAAAETPFTAGIWEDRQTPARPWQDAKLMMIRFRQGGRVLPAGDAKQVYRALGKTPFVTLYGSCARTEDLAEYVTVYHLTQKLQQPFRITVLEGSAEVLVHEPIASPLPRGRLDLMNPFYEIAGSSPQEETDKGMDGTAAGVRGPGGDGGDKVER